jgi:hypothetical protein
MDVSTFKQNLTQTTAQDFENKALTLFRYQARHNAVYSQFVKALGILPETVQNLAQIPCLPIECFKHHVVLTGEQPLVQKIFQSSGTTGQINSQHHITDLDFYEQVSIVAFEQMYGKLENYHILALLPSYLERDNSSLVYMAEAFMRKSQSPHAGFYLTNYPELLQTIDTLRRKVDSIRSLEGLENSRKILLLGVTFALLDLAEQFSPDLSEVIVMETGGMKGRRKEIIREELHEILTTKCNVPHIHAEYGMTELRSQAYSKGEGIFTLPAWCKILLREVNDPLSGNLERKSGVINFIDLANVDSCAFLATQDLATQSAPEQYKILGRTDNSDIRGCNLLFA